VKRQLLHYITISYAQMHNKQKLWGTSILVSLSLQIWGPIPVPPERRQWFMQPHIEQILLTMVCASVFEHVQLCIFCTYACGLLSFYRYYAGCI